MFSKRLYYAKKKVTLFRNGPLPALGERAYIKIRHSNDYT